MTNYAEIWMWKHNYERPQEGLDNLSPIQYLLKKENSPKQDFITKFSPFQQQHHQNEIFYIFTKTKGIKVSNE